MTLLYSRYLYYELLNNLWRNQSIKLEINYVKEINFGMLWQKYDEPWLKYLNIFLPFFIICFTFNNVFHKKKKIFLIYKHIHFGQIYRTQYVDIFVQKYSMGVGLTNRHYGFFLSWNIDKDINIITSPFFFSLEHI